MGTGNPCASSASPLDLTKSPWQEASHCYVFQWSTELYREDVLMALYLILCGEVDCSCAILGLAFTCDRTV